MFFFTHKGKDSVLSNTRFVCLFVFVCTIPVFVLFEPV